MEAKNFLLTAGNGKKSTLDKAYNKHINCVLQTLDDELEFRWETYNLIITQLVKEDKINYFKEMKYRLTDGENPNEIILDILEREAENMDSLVWFLKRRVEEYMEEDYFKRFLV
jgi:hypothetical protein